MIGSIKRLFSRNKWPDADEYQKARWAYEGQGASATKAAWMLGAGFLAMTAFAGVVLHDRHELATLGDLKFVMIESNRTTGDVVSISPTDGTLVVDETKRRQFIRYWVQLWRSVPADPVVYNSNYLSAQVYMSESVFARIDEHMNSHPMPEYIARGHARMVRNVQVTPTGNGVRYRVDWSEAVYRNSMLIGEVKQTADIDLEQHTPTNEVEADANLFGFMIRGFYWSPPPGMS